MFWKYPLFISIITGLIWSVFWQIFFTMFGILSYGITLSINLVPFAISGSLAATSLIFFKEPFSIKFHIFVVMIMVSSIYFFSVGSPFFVKDNYGFHTFSLVVIISIFTWLSIYLTLSNIPIEKLSRYYQEKYYLRLFWGLGLVILIFITLVPFYIMIVTSLKNQQSMMMNPLDLSINFNSGLQILMSSYIELFTKFNFHIFILNSLIVSLVTVFITLLFSIPGAYALARLRFPSKELLSGSVLIIYLIPSIVLVVPLYSVFSQLGLRNSLIGLFIVYPATTIPVALYMLRGYFVTLSKEIDDAAIMDGLTRFQIIMKISIPLSKPAIISVALYVFMIAWNEFLFAFMFLDDTSLFTLSRGIVSLNSSEIPQQHLMAGAVIATLPVMIIFLYLEKFLISGLSSGGVKG